MFRTLELSVLSCEDLRIDRKLVKKNSYVVVRFADSSLKSHATNVDVDGGSRPRWNQKFVINMPTCEQSIILEVRRKRSSGSDKVVGMAIMPVSDFIGGYLPVNYLNLLSYRLRDLNGARNGIINVSVKVVDDAKAYYYSTGMTTKVADRNTSYTPSSESEIVPVCSVPLDQNVVTGFPVSFPYPS